MPSSSEFSLPPRLRWIRHLHRITGAGAMLAAAIVLTGWIAGSVSLQGIGYPITMKTNAAICLLALGFALLTLRSNPALSRAGRVGAMMAGAIAALTLSQHIFGWNLGIDELLFREAAGSPSTASPNRMGPNASSSFMLLALAILSTHRGHVRAVRTAQSLAIVTMTAASIAIVGYLYGTAQLYALTFYTAISLPTAIAIFMLSVGTLFAHPEVLPASALLSDAEGGRLARRLLIPCIAGPVVLGYVTVAGYRRGALDTGLGVGFIVVAMMLMLSAYVWRAAVVYDRNALARRMAEQERDAMLVREQAARDQAERANRLKDEFLATMSHELRTPLNAVVGWTEMLRSSAVPEHAKERALTVVARNAKLLARIVADLLDISRLATGQLQLSTQPIDVARVARTAVDMFSIDAAARDVQLTLDAPAAELRMSGDAERLQQVFGNLLSNALKFTPAGGWVRVVVRASGQRIQVAVTDSGEGIPPEFLPFVFERFRQADSSTTREQDGLGLGLSIARDLVELHGGSIEAHSGGPGQGATFTVTLPAA